MLELRPFRKNEKNVNENSVFNYLDDLERNFFGGLSNDVSCFRADVVDQGDHYELRADLPGFKKEEIQINIDDNTMTVRAEHKEEAEETKENYVRRERRYGSFSRSFDLTGIAKENIDAEYADGVLKLTLPKETPAAPASRQIAVR